MHENNSQFILLKIPPPLVRLLGKIHVLGIEVLYTAGLIAHLDARPPGMQMVVGSILGSGNILSWRLVMKSFLQPFSPYNWFK